MDFVSFHALLMRLMLLDRKHSVNTAGAVLFTQLGC
jgi:hypothetical protein